MKARYGFPEDWEPDEPPARSLRGALCSLPPRDYDVLTRDWTLERLFEYLSARTLKQTVDELKQEMEKFRKEIGANR